MPTDSVLLLTNKYYGQYLLTKENTVTIPAVYNYIAKNAIFREHELYPSTRYVLTPKHKICIQSNIPTMVYKGFWSLVKSAKCT